MTHPRLSVIIPHYAQAALLEKCLASLEAQTLAVADYEIIVGDNGPQADTAPLAVRFRNVRFVPVAERGAALARNAAIAAARGEHFAFIDADCIAAPDWLERGLAALEAHHLVGGAVRVFPADVRALSPVEAFETVFAFRQALYVQRKKFSVTANLFASRRAVDATGPFRAGVPEDVDWCRRARALGFRLAFNDTTIISHPARRDWDALVQKWDRTTRERWTGFDGSSPARKAIWIALAAATALSAAPHLPRVLFSTRLKKTGDRVKAAGVLIRIRLWRAGRMLALAAGRRETASIET